MTATPDRPVSILIADDHPVVRSGLRTVLEKNSSFRIACEAENGDNALQLIRQMKPDVAVIDIEMPLLDGFAVARTVQDEAIPVDIVFMTMHNDELTFNKAMDAGVKGFVLKENAVTDIVRAIQEVRQGKYFISPFLSDYLLQRKRAPAPGPAPLENLTPAERNILRLIAEQKTTKTIAGELFISPKTVERHRSNICAKLDLHGSYALLKFTMENRGRL